MTAALRSHPHLRPVGPARRRRRDARAGRVRRAGDPHRGPGDARAVGHRAPARPATSTATASPDGGSGFINHNVEKLGITLNLRTERGKELLAELVRVSDAVTENFAAGVMERLGFGYERLKELRPDVVYVSNCGFGQTGPYRHVQVVGPDRPGGVRPHPHVGPAGPGAGRLGLLVHGPHRRLRDGHRPARRAVPPAPHGRGPVGRPGVHRGRHRARRSGGARRHRERPRRMRGDGRRELEPQHVAGDGAARRLPVPRRRLVGGHRLPSRRRLGGAGRRHRRAVGEGRRAGDARRAPRRPGRPRRRARGVDARHGRATRSWPRCAAAGVPVAPVTRPPERCDDDAANAGVGPVADDHPHQARRRGGSTGCRCTCRRPTGSIERGGPVLGEDNERVYGEVLGLSTAEIGRLHDDGVI